MYLRIFIFLNTCSNVDWHIVNVINAWNLRGRKINEKLKKTRELSGFNAVDIKCKHKVLLIDELFISARSIEVVQTFFEVNVFFLMNIYTNKLNNMMIYLTWYLDAILDNPYYWLIKPCTEIILFIFKRDWNEHVLFTWLYNLEIKLSPCHIM